MDDLLLDALRLLKRSLPITTVPLLALATLPEVEESAGSKGAAFGLECVGNKGPGKAKRKPWTSQLEHPLAQPGPLQSGHPHARSLIYLLSFRRKGPCAIPFEGVCPWLKPSTSACTSGDVLPGSDETEAEGGVPVAGIVVVAEGHPGEG
jgi:hypothetical protein